MRRIAKNSSLYEFTPDLVPEWHPSANGSLTPMNVKIVYPGKVWWICRQSHEWRATIKSRIKGHGCPLCSKDSNTKFAHASQKTPLSKNSHPPNSLKIGAAGAIFEPDTFDANIGSNFRKSRRYKLTATAVLESPHTGHWVYADVRNISAGGMCFELDACFNPGTKVTIKLDRPLLISGRTKYDSIIKWCKVMDMENRSTSPQRMGAEFI
jgi:hypothetical protein